LRWKLLTLASLVAALVGAGACIAAARFLDAPARGLTQSGWVAAALVVPVAAITFASVFVYRHTARRRALQAAATALLAALLTLTALLVGSILTRRATPELLPPPPPSAKAS
jgi:heme/copper-type cytochrome/quinol oxidase subunit 2